MFFEITQVTLLGFTKTTTKHVKHVCMNNHKSYKLLHQQYVMKIFFIFNHSICSVDQKNNNFHE